MKSIPIAPVSRCRMAIVWAPLLALEEANKHLLVFELLAVTDAVALAFPSSLPVS